MQVAIDGPAGSGKSTICKIIAEKYGLIYIDTGAMYRSIAWIGENFGYDDIEKKAGEVDFKLEEGGRVIKITYNGKEYNITNEIRTPEISSKVAEVAKNPKIREILVKKQQSYGRNSDIIMEGRDITTVVLPNADVKIFLTASAEERAKRRYNEWISKGEKPVYEEVLSEIVKRDEIDSNRETSPLIRAEDAEYIDTTGLSLEEVADKIGLIIEKIKRK